MKSRTRECKKSERGEQGMFELIDVLHHKDFGHDEYSDCNNTKIADFSKNCL